MARPGQFATFLLPRDGVYAASAASALLLSACSHEGPGVQAAGRFVAGNETLRVAMSTEPNTLSPLFALNDYEQFADRFVFDVLVTASADGRHLLPRLAAVVPTLENGGISRDGLTLTYRLRRGVRWHDGAPFTSRDVAFSFSALVNPANDVPNRHGYDRVRSVSTPDAATVVFHLKRPYAPAVTELFGDAAPNPILPAHLLARYPALNRLPFDAAPVGTGPFKVLRWDRGQALELVRNDDYYGGRPRLRRISLRFVPDESTAIDQLRTGELDVLVEASVAAYGRWRDVPGIRSALVDIHGASTLTMNVTHGALRDVRVRRAVAAAIDKRAIVDRFTFGAATPATADLPPFQWAFDPRAQPPAYDPARAKALLRDAGWIAQADGIVAKNGEPLRLVLAFAQNNATARVVVVALQAALRAVGIDVELKGYNAAQLFAPYAAHGVYQSGAFDLAWYTMTLGLDPASDSRFSCDAVPPNGQNYSRYCDAAMDAAQSAGLASFERGARVRAYAESQRLLARDVPVDFIFWPKDVSAYRDGVRGFAPNPVTPSWNAEQWSVVR